MKERVVDLAKESIAWLLLPAAVLPVFGTVALEFAGCDLLPPAAASPVGDQLPRMTLSVAGLLFGFMGFLLLRYRPENRMSWILGIVGLFVGLMMAAESYTACHAAGVLDLPGIAYAAWLTQIGGALMILNLFVLVPAVFPDGRFLSLRWRRVIESVIMVIIVLLVLQGLTPGPLDVDLMSGGFPADNPFGLPWPGLRRLAPVVGLLIPWILISASAVAIFSFVIRFRRSRGETRQQFKWFAFFLSTVILTHVVGFELLGGLFYPEIFEHWSYAVIVTLSFGGFPIVIGLTIFKYRLYDIDIIIRRTLVYGALTTLLALVYLASVALIQSLFTAVSGQRSPISIVISTLLIAALFNPIRHRVQAFVDRRFYRSQYDAAQTLARFATVARDEVDLDELTSELVRVVQETVQPERMGLWLKQAAGGREGENMMSTVSGARRQGVRSD